MKPQLVVAAIVSMVLAVVGAASVAMAFVIIGWNVGGALLNSGPTPRAPMEIARGAERGPAPQPPSSASRVIPEQQRAPARASRVIPEQQRAPARASRVNGQPLTAAQRQHLMQRYGQVPPGDHWYDSASGMYGPMGGPPAGVLEAGMRFAPMASNVSGGRTGVYLNGRRVPAAELEVYRAMFGYTVPGRYWLDASGNFGREGSRVPVANLGGGSAQWRGESTRGGWDPMTSGTWDPNGNNHVISVDGEVLNLPY